MKLSAFKEAIGNMNELSFNLPDGSKVPSHYHITEVGSITKKFIDCGGVVREEQAVNFQLWYSDDTDHQLLPSKVLKIINIAERKLGIEDHEIEVEYQGATIGKYGLELHDGSFALTAKQTDCLATDQCGIPQEKKKLNLGDLISTNNNSCTPGGGCC